MDHYQAQRVSCPEKLFRQVQPCFRTQGDGGGSSPGRENGTGDDDVALELVPQVICCPLPVIPGAAIVLAESLPALAYPSGLREDCPQEKPFLSLFRWRLPPERSICLA